MPPLSRTLKTLGGKIEKNGRRPEKFKTENTEKVEHLCVQEFLAARRSKYIEALGIGYEAAHKSLLLSQKIF